MSRHESVIRSCCDLKLPCSCMAYTYTYIHTYIYIYTHTHTHTHTHTCIHTYIKRHTQYKVCVSQNGIWYITSAYCVVIWRNLIDMIEKPEKKNSICMYLWLHIIKLRCTTVIKLRCTTVIKLRCTTVIKLRCRALCVYDHTLYHWNVKVKGTYCVGFRGIKLTWQRRPLSNCPNLWAVSTESFYADTCTKSFLTTCKVMCTIFAYVRAQSPFAPHSMNLSMFVESFAGYSSMCTISLICTVTWCTQATAQSSAQLF